MDHLLKAQFEHNAQVGGALSLYRHKIGMSALMPASNLLLILLNSSLMNSEWTFDTD
jgi:hypothetical protein